MWFLKFLYLAHYNFKSLCWSLSLSGHFKNHKRGSPECFWFGTEKKTDVEVLFKLQMWISFGKTIGKFLCISGYENGLISIYKIILFLTANRKNTLQRISSYNSGCKRSFERFSCLEFVFEKSKHRVAGLKQKLQL